MLEKLKELNLKRWNACRVNTEALPELDKVSARLLASKARYQAVSKETGYPWPVIAVIHWRESSGNWKASLAQGDPWDQVSTHVPKGRGPFNSWEEAAIDALHEIKWNDWSIAGTLTYLERYNGLGYANRNRPSPYVWSKTDQYHSGKYTSDGRYNSNVIDSQPGCAALLIRLMFKDPTINQTYKWQASMVPGSKTITGTGIVGFGAAFASYFQNHAVEIALVTVTLVIASTLLIHYFTKDKTNVH